MASVAVQGYDSEGRGVVKENGKVVFVPGACRGDVISLTTNRQRKNHYEGRLDLLEHASPERAEPFCAHYADCGGCKLQHIQYLAQLALKERHVHDVVQRIGKVQVVDFMPIVGCGETQYYRNKLEFSASALRWWPQGGEGMVPEALGALGYHAPGRWDKVLHIDQCHLQPEPSNAIRNEVFAHATAQGLPFYDPRSHQGVLRSVLIRNNEKGQYMVGIMVTSAGAGYAPLLLAHLRERFPAIETGFYYLNDKHNDTVYDLAPHLVFGTGQLVQAIGQYSFLVDAKSFMQTNLRQTEVLYQWVRQFAGLEPGETLYDLFCGVGTIGIYLAQDCQRVIGIETVEEAVGMAQQNARLNGVGHAVFLMGTVEELLNGEWANKHPLPDVVVVDPPRMGLHPKALEAILQLLPRRVVYVSCNPATLARDLGLLQSRYTIDKLVPVDMFPHTPHVECVAQLNRM